MNNERRTFQTRTPKAYAVTQGGYWYVVGADECYLCNDAGTPITFCFEHEAKAHADRVNARRAA